MRGVPVPIGFLILCKSVATQRSDALLISFTASSSLLPLLSTTLVTGPTSSSRARTLLSCP